MHDTSSLNDLAVILAAAFLGGALLRQMRQPVLVGYILVGALFGPTGLGLVADLAGIQWLAELGILLLMFYIGMELDISQFKRVARPAILTTTAQIIFGIGCMMGLGAVLGWAMKTSLLLGCCLALSSTAVALKVLEEMDVQKTPAGQTSLGILIAQDISLVPMMLILGALSVGGSFEIMGLVKLAVGLVILGLVLWLSSEQPKWFMHGARQLMRLKSKAMKDQTAITALAICFAAAALAGAYGLSSAYGAFLAGLALGRTKSREKLHRKTQPIFDVLIMVFFLSVGLLIDVKYVFENWAVVGALVLATLILKTLLNVLILRLQGVQYSDAILTGAVTGQIGEFSFLLAAMGLADKTLDASLYKVVVAVISLNLMFTPLWLNILRRLKLLPAIARRDKAEALESAARSVA